MTANEVELALTATAEETGPLLLATQEDQWFDRKSARLTPKDLAPVLVAFANAEGGVVVLGLHNNEVQGIDSFRHKVNEFRQVPIDFTSPPVRVAFLEVDCTTMEGKPDHLLVIRIDPSERVHETQNGDCYLRVGDESRKLTFAQRQELQFDKGQSQYDGFPIPGVDFDTLDEPLMRQYRRATGGQSPIRDIFKARSLLTRS